MKSDVSGRALLCMNTPKHMKYRLILCSMLTGVFALSYFLLKK